MSTHRLFISHASEDVAFAQRLSDNLRQLGADVWLDTSHMGSGDFVSRINFALQNRDVVVLVLTPAAIQSEWVQQEVNAAIAREKAGLMKPLIVIMAKPTPIASIPPLWNVYHRYDASRDYARAFYDVAAELGLTIPQQQKPVYALPAFTGKSRLRYPWLFRLSLTGVICILLGILVEISFLLLTINSQYVFNSPFIIILSTFAIAFYLGFAFSFASFIWALVLSFQLHDQKWSLAFISLFMLLIIMIVLVGYLSQFQNLYQNGVLVTIIISYVICIIVYATLPVIYSLQKRTTTA